MNRISKLFQPSLIIPKNATIKNQEVTSKSQKLMLEVGLMRPCANGTFYILPMLQKSVENLIKLIDHYLKEIECQKLQLPILTPADLWKKTGRFETAKAELMLTKDRHDKLQILSPTHEESITNLIAAISPVTYRNFPLKLYQITTKFRDEMKPRFGLIRAKEFLMKDLYTFDLDLKGANDTYVQVQEQYDKIFKSLEVPFVKVCGDTGVMGGNTSHEYHYLTDIGEDQILECAKCARTINKELANENGKICNDCGTNCMKTHNGIEIGHTFVLEDKYTKQLKATYLSKSGKPEILQMGCYGIGVTRVIAAAIEYLSSESEIRWPFLLAPFKVCLIPPKEGSKEEDIVEHFTENFYRDLNQIELLRNAIVVDDRTQFTIGKRLMDSKKFGYPFVVVIGGKTAESGKFELHQLGQENKIMELDYEQIMHYIRTHSLSYQLSS